MGYFLGLLLAEHSMGPPQDRSIGQLQKQGESAASGSFSVWQSFASLVPLSVQLLSWMESLGQALDCLPLRPCGLAASSPAPN